MLSTVMFIVLLLSYILWWPVASTVHCQGIECEKTIAACLPPVVIGNDESTVLFHQLLFLLSFISVIWHSFHLYLSHHSSLMQWYTWSHVQCVAMCMTEWKHPNSGSTCADTIMISYCLLSCATVISIILCYHIICYHYAPEIMWHCLQCGGRTVVLPWWRIQNPAVAIVCVR